MDDAALTVANAAYYRAFAARDLGAMSDLWAEEGVSCVFTLAGRRSSGASRCSPPTATFSSIRYRRR
ncbi:MAG: nuclear transport factor 2 family protein [Methylocystis sp.]